jgi:uncharacterized heparinase superfamily protein
MLYSRNSCAGCLSFEMSSGPQRIVINCGLPASGPELRRLARTTAAHSTASVADTSSCRFLAGGAWWGEARAIDWLSRRIGPVVLSGPTDVRSERTREADAHVLAARHDGYAASFGLVHERRWRLLADGQALEGEDAFLRDGGEKGKNKGRNAGKLRSHEVAVRFHLHPGIAVRGRAGDGLELATPQGEVWHFGAASDDDAVDVAIEESVYFAGLTGARRTDQIIVYLRVVAEARLRWRFARVDATAS